MSQPAKCHETPSQNGCAAALSRFENSMPRETVITGGNSDEARKRDDALRPRLLREVIGQKAVAKRLGIAVNASKKLKEPLGHILFDGPPGLGKTTFAT